MATKKRAGIPAAPELTLEVPEIPEGVDLYQRCAKLLADQLAKATALEVPLFGSLSAALGFRHHRPRDGARRAKEMNSKRKETSEGRLAMSLVPC